MSEVRRQISHRDLWSGPTYELSQLNDQFRDTLRELPQFRDAIVSRYFQDPGEYTPDPRFGPRPIRLAIGDVIYEIDLKPGRRTWDIHISRNVSGKKEQLLIDILGDQSRIHYNVYDADGKEIVPEELNNDAAISKAEEFLAELQSASTPKP